jgi:predicted metal-dependent HD superfamily phosphohydrolase
VAQAVVPPRLIALLSSWGADPGAVAEAAADLVTRYAEPQRRYHTLEHIDEMLAVSDELGATEEVTCAVWFHDAYYEPARTDNEVRSAGYAQEVLGALGASPAFTREVARLVESTRLHDPGDADRNGQVLADADLAILGAPTDRYARYVRDVRAEYAHVSDDDWRGGRGRILSDFLARPTLFFSAQVRAACDAQARVNLRTELVALSPP